MHLWRPILHGPLRKSTLKSSACEQNHLAVSIKGAHVNTYEEKRQFQKKTSQLCYWLGLSLSRRLLFQGITLGLFTPKCWLSISFTPELLLFWGKVALITKCIPSCCLVISWRESRVFNLSPLLFFFPLYSAPSQGSSEKPIRDN